MEFPGKVEGSAFSRRVQFQSHRQEERESGSWCWRVCYWWQEDKTGAIFWGQVISREDGMLENFGRKIIIAFTHGGLTLCQSLHVLVDLTFEGWVKSCSPDSCSYLTKIPQVLVERGPDPCTYVLNPSACFSGLKPEVWDRLLQRWETQRRAAGVSSGNVWPWI